MRALSTLGLALRRLRRRPIRSLLLLQGTIWGVAVAIFPTAVLEGTRAAAVEEGRAYGVDRVAVVADPTSAAAVELSADDARFMQARLSDGGFDVAASGAVRVRRDLAAPVSGDDAVTILEASPGAARARGFELDAGRWLTAADDGSRCLVEAGVGRALGRDGLRPGDQVDIGGVQREIVGVLAARDPQALRTDDLGFDVSHPLYDRVARQFLVAMGMPISVEDDWKRSDACVYLAADAGAFDWIYIRVGAREASAAATTVRRAMVERDKTVMTLYPVVLPIVMGSEVDRFDAVNLAMFLACLVMGAVVMANLGLLNALTRAREIAIRRVEGATRIDIAWHFLGEGLILGALGALIGCVLGMALAELRVSLEPVSGFSWVFPVRHAATACGVAVLIGLLASLLPAIRASRQEPVKGLADD